MGRREKCVEGASRLLSGSDSTLGCLPGHRKCRGLGEGANNGCPNP